jgi:hypothetical protein
VPLAGSQLGGHPGCRRRSLVDDRGLRGQQRVPEPDLDERVVVALATVEPGSVGGVGGAGWSIGRGSDGTTIGGSGGSGGGSVVLVVDVDVVDVDVVELVVVVDDVVVLVLVVVGSLAEAEAAAIDPASLAAPSAERRHRCTSADPETPARGPLGVVDPQGPTGAPGGGVGGATGAGVTARGVVVLGDRVLDGRFPSAIGAVSGDLVVTHAVAAPAIKSALTPRTAPAASSRRVRSRR